MEMLEFAAKAHRIVEFVVKEEFRLKGKEVEFDLYLETFYTLQGGWKALFRTSCSNRVYYELTYNKGHKETLVRKCEVVRSFNLTDEEYELVKE